MTTCSADDSYGLLTPRNSTARRFSHVKTTRRHPHKLNPHNTLRVRYLYFSVLIRVFNTDTGGLRIVSRTTGITHPGSSLAFPH